MVKVVEKGFDLMVFIFIKKFFEFNFFFIFIVIDCDFE